MLERRLSALPLALLLLSTPLLAKNRVDLEYNVRFLPESDQAEVRITLDEGEEVRSLTFNLGKKGYYSDFQTDGQWQQSAPHSGVWQPKSGKSSLTYKVKVSHEREDGRFDARMTPDWALLRGDDLVSSARLDQVDGTQLVSRLQFELPKGWPSVSSLNRPSGSQMILSTARCERSTSSISSRDRCGLRLRFIRHSAVVISVPSPSTWIEPPSSTKPSV